MKHLIRILAAGLFEASPMHRIEWELFDMARSTILEAKGRHREGLGSPPLDDDAQAAATSSFVILILVYN